MANLNVTRVLVAAGALAVVVSGCSRQPHPTGTPAGTPQQVAAPAGDPKRCPVTIANGNGPPGERPSPDHHGNGALWTGLPPGGIERSGTVESDGSISHKFWWWTVGTEGGLTIRGQRLDTQAPPLLARTDRGVPETGFSDIPGGRFWASGITFPTEGCWRVTGTVGRTSLTFIIFVAKP